MHKLILKHSAIILISLVISYMTFYFVLEEWFMRFYPETFLSGLIARLFLAVFIYAAVISIINKKVNIVHIDILAIIYFVLIVVFSLFRESHISLININPLTIIDDFRRNNTTTMVLLISNIFVYFPQGVYIKYRTKSKNVILVFGFLIYIVIIESMQHFLHTGVCDINDILENTLGFYLGAIFFSFMMNNFKYKIKYKELSH